MSAIRPNLHTVNLLAAILTVALWLSGCISTTGVSDPVRAVVTVRVQAEANPDPKGRSLPIVVRLYQVSAPGEFERADFFELFEQTPTLAGDGYQIMDELEMVEGEEHTSQHELDSSARYVGAIAAFRLIQEAKWLGIAPVVAQSVNQVTVDVKRLQVDVTNQSLR
jgi:type VI secretion system protein VasD